MNIGVNQISDKAGIVRLSYIGPQPVERDDCGFWCHPLYYAGETEAGFKEWCAGHGLESHYTLLDNDERPEAEELSEAYYLNSAFPTCDGWEPVRPEGDGWFIGSIHETEDFGVVCVWLRNKGAKVGNH